MCVKLFYFLTYIYINMNEIFYVYHLIDPFNNTVFYVGKGYGERMYEHEKEVRRKVIPHKNKHLITKSKR